jgi:hypothetical protein
MAFLPLLRRIPSVLDDSRKRFPHQCLDAMVAAHSFERRRPVTAGSLLGSNR